MTKTYERALAKAKAMSVHTKETATVVEYEGEFSYLPSRLVCGYDNVVAKCINGEELI